MATRPIKAADHPDGAKENPKPKLGKTDSEKIDEVYQSLKQLPVILEALDFVIKAHGVAVKDFGDAIKAFMEEFGPE